MTWSVSFSSSVWPKKANAQKGLKADDSGEGVKLMRCLPLSEGVGDGGVGHRGRGRDWFEKADDVIMKARGPRNTTVTWTLFQRTSCTTSLPSSDAMTYSLFPVSVGGSTVNNRRHDTSPQRSILTLLIKHR